jgi:hypothetical protein
MAIDLSRADSVLREEAERAELEDGDPIWLEAVERLSEACEQVGIRTHIAFLGTAMLAKATDLGIDTYSVKATGGGPGAYSARSLCHGVLVPASVQLGIHLGVSGREPLNNMPYFRMQRLDDGTRVLGSARPIIALLKEILGRLQHVRSQDEARRALRSFIIVRRRYRPSYSEFGGAAALGLDQLIGIIEGFVSDDSEGGRRAQAIVAGLLDVFAGRERVESGRVNDPSRHIPGDVRVSERSDQGGWEKALEVRDKPVSLSDVLIFGRSCQNAGVREVAVVAVAQRQPLLPADQINDWAHESGIGLTVFYGWQSFVRQVLFWSEAPIPDAVVQAIPLIHQRLIEVEVSERGVDLWGRLVGE